MFPAKTSRSLVLLLFLVATGRAIGQDGTDLAPLAPADPVFEKGSWVSLKTYAGPLTPGGWIAEPYPAVYQVVEVLGDQIRLGLPGDANVLLRRDAAYSTEATLRGLGQYIRAYPANPQYLHERGLVALGAHLHAEAIADFTEVLRLDPHNANAYYHRGLANERSFEGERAFGDLFEAIRLDPTNPEFYKARARVAASRGAHRRAVADDTTALRFTPGDTATYKHRAASNYALHQYAFAIDDYNALLVADPDDEDAILGLSVALEEWGRLKEAREEIDRLDTLVNIQSLMVAINASADASLMEGPLPAAAPPGTISANAPKFFRPISEIQSKAILARARITEKMGEDPDMIYDSLGLEAEDPKVKAYQADPLGPVPVPVPRATGLVRVELPAVPEVRNEPDASPRDN